MARPSRELHVIRAFTSAFGGTAVEYFETVVIAYAILRAGFPREAVLATIVGHVIVFAAAVFLWPVQEYVPVFWMRLAAASMLTLMGLYWSAKSIKRLIEHRRPRWVDDPLGEVGLSDAPRPSVAAFSLVAFLAMFKSSIVEAFEILLVVFPIGAATGEWWAIVIAVGAAIALVTLLAVLLHRYLKRIPEVKLKLAIGCVLAAIGISWLAELALEA